MRPGAKIEGHADRRFAAVADAFHAILEPGGPGAAVCVYHLGVRVVDLWGGCADARSGRPWQRDTAVPLFSTGKAAAALVALLAVSRGWLGLDEPLARHWPSFGGHGKDRVTLRHVLDHSSGLVLFGRPVPRSLVADRARMSSLLEAMVPRWAPGSRWGYQMGTFGELLSEALRRVDPGGRRFDRLFDDLVADPMGIDLRFGLADPPLSEDIARVLRPSISAAIRDLRLAPAGLWRQAVDPTSLLQRSGRELRDLDANDPGWMRLPFPSANAVGSARGVASLYAELVAGGRRIGLDPVVLDDVLAPPRFPPGGGRDRVMGVDLRWRLGFMRPGPAFPFSPSGRAFGMPGFGGSFAFADPDAGLAYGFAPSRLGVLPFEDPRERSIRVAALAAAGAPLPAGA